MNNNYQPPPKRPCRYCGEMRYPTQFHQGTRKCTDCRMKDDRVRRESRRNAERFACTDWRYP